MSEPNVLTGHGLRETRTAPGRYLGDAPALPEGSDGYWLIWTCACGVEFGGTATGVPREVARQLHRLHKAFMSEPPVGTYIVQEVAPNRRWWRRRRGAK